MKNKLLEKIQNDNSEMFDFFKKLSQELYENIDLTHKINITFDQKMNDILRNNKFYNLFEDFYFVKNKDINYLNGLLFCKNKEIVSLKFNKTEFDIDAIIIPTNIKHLSVRHHQDLSFIYNNTETSPAEKTSPSEISFLNKTIDQDMIETAQLKCDLDISGIVDFNMTPFLINKEDGIELLKNYTSEEKFKIRPKLPR